MRNCLPFLSKFQVCLVSQIFMCVMMIASEELYSVDDSLTWNDLPALPDSHGFAGPFAGTHCGSLLVAGGANFPDKMPWEGGTKLWYDKVFALSKPDAQWKMIGKLRRPIGYGVSLSTEAGIVCIGGSDMNQHYSDCFIMSLNHDRLEIAMLPSLPKPCANFCGALIGNTIYVAGGIETPTATTALKTFWSLDLGMPRSEWRELEAWPGPARMLAVAAVLGNAFYLASGAELTGNDEGKPVRRYLQDVYCFQPLEGWKRVSDMPRPAVAAPTPAPILGNSMLVISGDDGMKVDFKPPDDHPGFPKSVLAYNTTTDTWKEIGNVPLGQVTTPIVQWNDGFVIPSGEIRPGVRTPAIWFGH